MASEITDAVNKLLQFSGHTNPETPVSRKDLAPVLGAVAAALSEIDKRLKAMEGS